MSTGLFLAPLKVEASFLSSLLNNQALAQTNIPNIEDSTNNSQTIPLLQANTSSVAFLQDNNKEVYEDSNLNIVANNALLPETGPMSTSDVLDFDAGEISIYVVRSGDTVSQVATMFDVSVDTILAANDMKKGEKLKEGDILLILPISGLEHTVTKGDTLKGIATKYKIDIEDILDANHLETDAKLIVGEKILVPGAHMLNETKPKSTNNIASKGSSKVPSVVGYFVNPVPSAIKSRGVKPGHKGVDLAAPTGTKIRASAGGVVLIARNGYNGGFGNYVVVQHPNGVKTLYGHMSKLGTSPGATVSRGETIGYVGNTGRSTGPHLHFEVIGAKNPF